MATAFMDNSNAKSTRIAAASIPVKMVPRRTAIEPFLQLGTGMPPTPQPARRPQRAADAHMNGKNGGLMPGLGRDQLPVGVPRR